MLQRQDVVHQRYQLQQKLNQNASRQTWLAIDLSAQPSQPGFSFSLCPKLKEHLREPVLKDSIRAF